MLRRTAVRLVAAVVVFVATVVAGSGQAWADSYGPLRYLRNHATNWCLATDWSQGVYSWGGCNGPQRWQFGFLDAYPGTALLKNEATGRCLKQVDFTTVLSAPCDGSVVEFRWVAYDGFIWSVNTGGHLVTDWSGKVSLHNDTNTLPANQWWYWTG
ncbi:hypothetical protein ACFV4N_31980 [Actinosynnema sp. NPDC059797]